MEPEATSVPTQGFMLRNGFELQQKPVSSLVEFETSTPDLFGVTHMGVCQLERNQWYLDIDGLVKKPLKLHWDDLSQFPKKKMMAVHECAGNPLLPKVPVRRMGNIIWEGIALRDVLQEVGVLPEARYMWSTGADEGLFNQMPLTHYQKDLTIETAFNGDVMLATHLNGQLLSTERGAPVRLVVPDFYGTNSTKWLSSLQFHSGRCPGYFASKLYNEEVDGVMKPVWALAPHSVFVSHQQDQVITPGLQNIWGWAWSAGGVAQVEVSTDGGKSWRVAELEGRFEYSWQKFNLDWQAEIGEHKLICRARSNDGRVQPETEARNIWFSVILQVRATE